MVSADEVSGIVIGAAMKVHSTLGPGLSESAYELCLVHELIKLGQRVQRQLSLPIHYDGVQLDCGYRIDVLVSDLVVVELKTVEALTNLHKAQILTYLKLSGKELGLLINFNTVHLRDGIKRVLNGQNWK